MKVLFISGELYNKTGGGMNMRSHRKVIERVVGRENVYAYVFSNVISENESDENVYFSHYKNTKFIKIINTIRRGDPAISYKAIYDLLEIIRTRRIDVVYLGRSTQGMLIDHIKHEFPMIKIVSFYHDMMSDVIKKNIRTNMVSFGSNCFRYIYWLKSERNAAIKSDINLCLNSRDADLFKKQYGFEPDYVFPVICEDYCFPLNDRKRKETGIHVYFFGSFFYPNVEGIRWFAKRVIPYVCKDVELYIVGKDMDRLIKYKEMRSNRIKIIGTVDTLKEYYEDADLVVGPILRGTGMKTKTAEALMYGKNYIGTSEALCGYDDMKQYICNDSIDFIDKINRFCASREVRFSLKMRELYEKSYSIEAGTDKMRKILDKVKQA